MRKKKFSIHLDEILISGDNLRLSHDRVHVVNNNTIIASFPHSYVKHNLRQIMIFDDGDVVYNLKNENVMTLNN